MKIERKKNFFKAFRDPKSTNHDKTSERQLYKVGPFEFSFFATSQNCICTDTLETIANFLSQQKCIKSFRYCKSVRFRCDRYDEFVTLGVNAQKSSALKTKQCKNNILERVFMLQRSQNDKERNLGPT